MSRPSELLTCPLSGTWCNSQLHVYHYASAVYSAIKSTKLEEFTLWARGLFAKGINVPVSGAADITFTSQITARHMMTPYAPWHQDLRQCLARLKVIVWPTLKWNSSSCSIYFSSTHMSVVHKHKDEARVFGRAASNSRNAVDVLSGCRIVFLNYVCALPARKWTLRHLHPTYLKTACFSSFFWKKKRT